MLSTWEFRLSWKRSRRTEVVTMSNGERLWLELAPLRRPPRRLGRTQRRAERVWKPPSRLFEGRR